MKSLIDLKNAITHPEFLEKQFSAYRDKNILFINPQLSGKDLYRVFLPYFSLSETSATAIHHISNYNPEERIIGGKETQIDDYMIDWAHYIIFPFTTQPLAMGLYRRIRQRNPSCKIVYLVDFNFYEIRPTHPFYSIFKDASTLTYVEDNMFYSDLVVVSNIEMMHYLVKKLSKDVFPMKYRAEKTNMAVSCMPFMIDTEFVMANIDSFIPEVATEYKQPETVHTPLVKNKLEATAKAAKTVVQKKTNLKNKQAKKHALKKAAKATKHAKPKTATPKPGAGKANRKK